MSETMVKPGHLVQRASNPDVTYVVVDVGGEPVMALLREQDDEDSYRPVAVELSELTIVGHLS